jgi:hypothetical protein
LVTGLGEDGASVLERARYAVAVLEVTDTETLGATSKVSPLLASKWSIQNKSPGAGYGNGKV